VTRILLVEDEESYRDPLAYLLTREGYEVVTAATGIDALEAFDEGGADLVLLDLMLPGLSGTEVCRQIRRVSDVPVIMLTAKDGEIDKVVGLELGADDYVTKPYSSRELLARVRAVLRRRVSGTAAAEDDEDPQDDGILAAGPVLTRVQLIDRVWGTDYVGDTKTLDVHVKRVRAKIEADPANPTLLVTVRGLGYKLQDEPPTA
jgi:two-component system response regulator RegX3